MNDILRDRRALSLAALLGLLIICNLAFAHFSGWFRWSWQLFSFAGLFAVYKIGGLSLSDIGLAGRRISTGLIYAGLSMALVFAVLLTAFFIDQNIFKDNRYHHSLSSAMISGFFVLPLKTVLFEEFAFRGIMPAVLKKLVSKTWLIYLTTSVLFGVWHITTAPNSANLSTGNYSNFLILTVVFLVTSLGGAILYYLRRQSHSLVAPIVAHWFINGSAIVLAALSWSAT